jgi:hypothetical protein
VQDKVGYGSREQHRGARRAGEAFRKNMRFSVKSPKTEKQLAITFIWL